MAEKKAGVGTKETAHPATKKDGVPVKKEWGAYRKTWVALIGGCLQLITAIQLEGGTEAVLTSAIAIGTSAGVYRLYNNERTKQ